MPENDPQNRAERDEIRREELETSDDIVDRLDETDVEGDHQHYPSLEELRNARSNQLGFTVDPHTAVPYPADEVEEIKDQKGKRSESIWRRRWKRFKSIKRGYYSFLVLVFLYGLSFLLPLLVNNKALIVHYDGETYFPALMELLPGVASYYPGTGFGQEDVIGEAMYRELDEEFESDGGDNYVVMPPYTWNPVESDFNVEGAHPQAPSSRHLLGTDDAGRDVFARLAYGFNVSISFAIILSLIYYVLGIIVGGIMGYFGGLVDLLGQRVVEIWENLPFLFMVIIISSMIQPSFMLLILILAVFQWIGISYFIRGEFLREKARDYVAAAISLGATNRSIIFKHILPNSLTPIITFFPFAIIGGISTLVSLDFLGFGLQPPTPSWGQMMDVGLQNMTSEWLIITPVAAMFFTLLIVTFIGEAARAAFDPKVFSRLR